MHHPIVLIQLTEASLQLCAGPRVKTEARAWDCRRVRVLTGLLDLDVRPVSSQFLGFPVFPHFLNLNVSLPVTFENNVVNLKCFFVDRSGVQPSLSQRRPVCVTRRVHVSAGLDRTVLRDR